MPIGPPTIGLLLDQGVCVEDPSSTNYMVKLTYISVGHLHLTSRFCEVELGPNPNSRRFQNSFSQ